VGRGIDVEYPLLLGIYKLIYSAKISYETLKSWDHLLTEDTLVYQPVSGQPE